MMRKLFALSALAAMVFAFANDAQAGRCRTRCGRTRHHHCGGCGGGCASAPSCAAPCGGCGAAPSCAAPCGGGCGACGAAPSCAAPACGACGAIAPSCCGAAATACATQGAACSSGCASPCGTTVESYSPAPENAPEPPAEPTTAEGKKA